MMDQRRARTMIASTLSALLWLHAGATHASALAGAPAVVAQDAKAADALVVGASTLVRLDGRVELVVVADPEVVDAKPVSPGEVLLVGRAHGATDVVFRLESGESVVRRVVVGIDANGLATRLRELFGANLAVQEVDGVVALRGRVPDVRTAELLRAYMGTSGHKWIDLTHIPGVQQVQLRVRIAEASRTALRELGFSGVVGGSSAFGGVQAPGGSPFQSVSISPQPGSPVGSADFAFDAAGSPVSSATTLFAGAPSANLEAYLQALAENRYVRLLAEPNLVAVSGEQATFLVGGEFPVPIVQGSVVGGGSTITIQYKEFGVRLNFRPQVLGQGRIRLEVAPEVSELSEIGALKQNGFTIPGIVTRRSNTTVELANGQSFALAGLLRSKDQARSSKVPGLGDLPVLGSLFRSVRYEQDQTELVVMVTAELVEPLEDGRLLPLPGDLHVAPNDWELFMEGELHGKARLNGASDRLAQLGLGALRGPGAWRRPDEPRVAAADAPPAGGAKQ
jgi:pilus assembly protein CpaC